MDAAHAPSALLPRDARRGPLGMYWLVLTEAMLFVSLFFSYFLLARQQSQWPTVPPAKLWPPLTMLVLLLVSSATVEWARRQARRQRLGGARLGLALTIALGLAFLCVQFLEYRERLQHLTPQTDAYGSMFYAITGLHGAHLVLGLLMLGYVALLLKRVQAPHRPVHVASIYWHFIDLTWVVIVVLLYLLPRFTGG